MAHQDDIRSAGSGWRRTVQVILWLQTSLTTPQRRGPKARHPVDIAPIRGVAGNLCLAGDGSTPPPRRALLHGPLVQSAQRTQPPAPQRRSCRPTSAPRNKPTGQRTNPSSCPRELAFDQELYLSEPVICPRLERAGCRQLVECFALTMGGAVRSGRLLLAGATADRLACRAPFKLRLPAATDRSRACHCGILDAAFGFSGRLLQVQRDGPHPFAVDR